MFRETNTNTQMSLFDNPADLMGKRAVKKYEDPKAWFNLRRIVLFQGKNAPEGTTGAHNGPLSTLMVLLNAMSQTCVHLKLYFSGTGFRLAMVAAGLKY